MHSFTFVVIICQFLKPIRRVDIILTMWSALSLYIPAGTNIGKQNLLLKQEYFIINDVFVVIHYYSHLEMTKNNFSIQSGAIHITDCEDFSNLDSDIVIDQSTIVQPWCF